MIKKNALDNILRNHATEMLMWVTDGTTLEPVREIQDDCVFITCPGGQSSLKVH